jgi:hypothetical protein
MSHQEIDRLKIIQQINSRQITQKEAAVQLQLTVRQVKRLAKRFRDNGAEGLISKHRGKVASNRIPDEVKNKALELIRATYLDFSPTFAHEKLTELHQLSFSVETLRRWMIEAQIWQSKAIKKARIHPSRPRRSQRGELIQIDGSPHAWFEERGEPCTLIVFIDDASSELMGLHFSPTETTQAYMATLANYLNQFGRPVSLYSDKHSIFRVNHANCEGKLTQFSRVLKTLDIEAIHANTPQAKGRVERANKTLQDRLVKELRLQNISTIEKANQYLPTFMKQYNQRFAVEPRSPIDAHRKVLHNDTDIKQILSIHHQRKLTKNLSCQLNNIEYQIITKTKGYRLRQSYVTFCEEFNGTLTILQKGRALEYRTLNQGEAPIPIVDEKTIHNTVEQAKRKQAKSTLIKPKVDHPWKRSYKNTDRPTA